jgi:hypothetical protein
MAGSLSERRLSLCTCTCRGLCATHSPYADRFAQQNVSWWLPAGVQNEMARSAPLPAQVDKLAAYIEAEMARMQDPSDLEGCANTLSQLRECRSVPCGRMAAL